MKFWLGFHHLRERAYSSCCAGLSRVRQNSAPGRKLGTHTIRSRNTPAMPRQSLIEYIAESARHGSGMAYAHRSGYRTARWSYRDVAGVAAQVARELEARGIQPGDRVLLWGRNSAEWVAAFFGCILRGG